jgi:hypothetical protein
MSALIARASCPTCRTNGLADRGEDGFAEMETVPCQGSDDCRARLCAACERKCSDCGLPACSEHLVDVSGKTICAICLAGQLADAFAELYGAAEIMTEAR